MIPWNGLSYHPTTYEQKNKRSLIIVQDDSLNIHIAICNILGSSEYFLEKPMKVIIINLKTLLTVGM